MNLVGSLWTKTKTVFLVSCFFTALESKERLKNSYFPKKYSPVVLISIDGLPWEYLKEGSELWDKLPTLSRLRKGSHFFEAVQSVNPSITFPAHTTMVTGVDPALHGIQGNLPFDPFSANKSGWMWYAEDIKVPAIWDLAKQKKKKVGNVFWPVTVGARIDYNLPQFWRERIPEDDKLLRALSTQNLHKEMQGLVGKPLNETTGDSTKFQTASQLLKSKRPDLLLVYTTDLDSIHHAVGLYHDRSIARLVEIDAQLGKFLEDSHLWKNPHATVIVTSDHGFRSIQAMCYPNSVLVEKGYLQPSSKSYQMIFRALGGVSVLYGKDKTNLSEEEKVRLELEFRDVCPGGQLVTSGEAFLRLQQELEPKALGFFVSDGTVYFSSSWEGEAKNVFVSKPEFYAHGFWNDQDEMKTVAFVYPRSRKLPREIRSLKDVFYLTKEFLKL